MTEIVRFRIGERHITCRAYRPRPGTPLRVKIKTILLDRYEAGKVTRRIKRRFPGEKPSISLNIKVG